MKLNELKIAEICHEANKLYCEAIGDHSQVSWDKAPDWQRESVINGVIFKMGNPNADVIRDARIMVEREAGEGMEVWTIEK